MKISIILLGGARRVTLAEQLRTFFNRNGYETAFISIERDRNFYPISSVAEVIQAPKFSDPTFEAFLNELMRCSENPLLISCMDSALPTMAQLRGKKFGKANVVAPTESGAYIALNKKATYEFCLNNKIMVPANYGRKDTSVVTGRIIAKPVEGFGGKGIEFFERLGHIPESLFDTHIIQDFVEGQETTHDVYITRENKFYVSSRDRLAVIDGEVDHCMVRPPKEQELKIIEKISKSEIFQGPVTVQTISNDFNTFLIEINSRYGGGVTASIAAGFPAFELYAYDTYGINIQHPKFMKLEMKRARRDFYRVV